MLDNANQWTKSDNTSPYPKGNRRLRKVSIALMKGRCSLPIAMRWIASSFHVPHRLHPPLPNLISYLKYVWNLQKLTGRPQDTHGNVNSSTDRCNHIQADEPSKVSEEVHGYQRIRLLAVNF